MRRAGLTRIEVLVILAVVALTLSLAAVFLVRQRENGLRLQCFNNLRRLGLAVHAWHENSGATPQTRTLPPSRLADGYATWAVLLAPHLEAERPFGPWDLTKSYSSQDAKVRETLVTPLFCPARQRSRWLSTAGDLGPLGTHLPGALGDYACVAGSGDPAHPWTGPDADGALVLAEVLEKKDGQLVRWRSRTRPASLERGLGYTLLIGEKHVPPTGLGQAEFGDGSLYNGQHSASFSRVAGPGFPLASEPNAPLNNNFGGAHPRVCLFLIADGSVRALAVDVEEKVLGRMANRSK